MDILSISSLLIIIYGVAGLFGFQLISKKYRGHEWTKSYIRYNGLSWLMIGVPWFVINRACAYYSLTIGTDPLCLMLMASASPGFVFSCILRNKVEANLKEMENQKHRT